MTVIEVRRSAERTQQALGRLSSTARVRVTLRALITVAVALAVATVGPVATPGTTLVLGSAAIAWLMLSFEEDLPPDPQALARISDTRNRRAGPP